MRKNTIMRIAAVVLMCTLVTACFASSTFARYTSEATGTSDTAVVAKWSIVYDEDTQLAVSGDNATIEVDLFKTINHHAESDDETKLAPGTYGEFAFEDIVNESDVEAVVTITADVTNEANVPLQWSINGGTTWLEALPETIVDAQTLNAKDGTLTGQKIMWKWDFNEDGSADDSDTALGIAARTADLGVSVDLTITATQVDE